MTRPSIVLDLLEICLTVIVYHCQVVSLGRSREMYCVFQEKKTIKRHKAIKVNDEQEPFCEVFGRILISGD